MEAVIVTYNSAGQLSELVESESTRQAFTRLLVVDNASADGTVGIAQSAGLEVMRLPRNVGFGGAANAGVAAVAGDVVALLNPDIQVPDPKAIPRLLEHMEDSRVGIVAPSLRLPSGELQDSVRTVPTPRNILERRLGDRSSGWLMPERAMDVPWVVGAAMLLRRSAFTEVGGFDPRYHVYFEDVDLCERLRRKGWLIRFDPAVVLAHQHQGESRRTVLGWSTRQHMRSACLFYARFPSYLWRAGAGGRQLL